MNYEDFTRTIFRGIGQVMFQNNAFTGILFLIGIFYAFWLSGIGALIGVSVGTFTAILLKYDTEDIKNGIYGFNGTLIGIALLFFFEPNIELFIIIILASVASTILMHFMHEKKLSPYTFPFVITTWISIFLIKILNISSSAIITIIDFEKIDIFSGISFGFSQVMFQASMITGVIFFIAILINSRINALYALMGSLLGVLFGWLFFPTSLNLINTGIFGFNGVLCGIALSDHKLQSIGYIILTIILSIGILYLFMMSNLTALTAPFVLATWIMIFIKNKIG